MEQFIATALGLYLAITLPPAIVAWRRGLGARAVRRAFVLAVLLGPTLVGYVLAWLVALDDKPENRITLIIG